jgi:hypothetical protein
MSDGADPQCGARSVGPGSVRASQKPGSALSASMLTPMEVLNGVSIVLKAALSASMLNLNKKLEAQRLVRECQPV